MCEAEIVLLEHSHWLYSFFQLYRVWQNTLNFSESSIQGPQGWDLLVNWILERIRKDGAATGGRSYFTPRPNLRLAFSLA